MKVLSSYFGTMAMQHVEEGAIVEEGESLGEVEAMKVMMRIIAPCSGTLVWLVELGEVVGEDQEVAEIQQ